MTDCQFGMIASRYHDRELAPRETRDFEAHLAQCPACRAQLDDYARLDMIMSLGRSAGPDPKFVERLRALPASTATVRLWFDASRLGRILIPLAACFCLVFGALLFLQVRRQHEPDTPATATIADSTNARPQAFAADDTPLLGLTLTETEQQYLFADEGAALAGLYQTTDRDQ